MAAVATLSAGLAADAHAAQAVLAARPSHVVRRGLHIILRDSEGTRKVVFVGEGCKDLRIGRYPPIPVAAALDVPFGATLRQGEGGAWTRHRRCAIVAGGEAAAGEGEAGAEEAYEGNRHLPQDNSAQALSPAEVKALKGQRSGEEVVEALANNSATFASKTKFAQEKYLRKKQQKHVRQVTILRPTLLELCETYMQQSRTKVCGLRFDYLSSMLCQADVRSGGRYLVLDSACALVVGAMAQQVAGVGEVFRAFRGGCPEKALVELDLGERRAVVKPVPIEVLQSADPWSHEWLRPPHEGVAGEKAPTTDEELARQAARLERLRQRRESVRDLKARPVDALVVVAGEDEADLAAEVLEVGLGLLAPGGRLVVYGQHLQPLAARQGALRSSGGFVDVRLHQLFTREYQVLPQRTHPIMTAEAQLCEGFLLSATKVLDTAAPNDAGAPAAAAEVAAAADGAWDAPAAPRGGRGGKRPRTR